MKKKFKIICAALMLALGILGSAPQMEAHAETNNVNQVRESIVAVAIHHDAADGRDLGICYGSGFFVGKEGSDVQYLVTNHHVIKDYLYNGAGEYVNGIQLDLDGDGRREYYEIPGKMKIRVYFDSDDYEEGYAVDYDDAKDIAVLSLDKPSDKRKPLKLLSPTEDMVGSSIYTVGYPSIADVYSIDPISQWEMGDASVTKGIISRLLTTSGTGLKRIQTDAEIRSGNSGGPMVTEEGAVVGVNTWRVMNGNLENNYYAVNIDEVIPMLKLHDVEYEMSGADPEPPEPEPPTPDTEPDPVPEPPAPEPPKPDNTVIIIAAVIAAIVLLIIIAAFVLLKKKKKPVMENKIDPSGSIEAATRPEIARKAILRSLSSQHNGAIFQLSGKQILIGRDVANCTVIFQDGTPGVSRRHCSLSYDAAAQEFVLTDLKSSYGTFLMSGQKLTPGMAYRLRPGDQFYLGSSENLLRVEI